MNSYLTRHPEWREHQDLLMVQPTASEVVDEFPDAEGCSLLNDENARATDGSTRLAMYVRLRREGKDHRWADMMASQRPPGGQTTDTFWAGRKHFSEVYGEDYANRVKKALAKRGINLRPNEEYMPELASYRGDPAAVVPFSGARSYIKGLCERRGAACEGAVNVDARQPDYDPYDPKNCTPLGKDIVNNFAREEAKTNPDFKRKSRAEQRAHILSKHGPTP